ncbi:MAG: hypothetical protein HY434_02590 [Candidatus Liptonbacteria bacterium]|nr:hypothetical protein [Candidatus Liptonbacteria bacterium]
MRKVIFSILLLLVAAPYLVFADTAHRAQSIFPLGFWGFPDSGLLSCHGDPATNPNACKSFCDFIDTGVNIIYFVMTIALFALTPILFAWGGILILTAGANPGNIETGKKILRGTLIGMVIVLLAFVVIKSIVTFLGVDLPGITSALNCQVPQSSQ